MSIISKEKSEIENMAETGIVQIAMRASTELKNKVKIMAIKRGITMNDLLVEYVTEGLKRDEKKEDK